MLYTYINNYLHQPFHFYINQMKTKRVQFANLSSPSPSFLRKSLSSPGAEESPLVMDDFSSTSSGRRLMRAFISLSLLTLWSFLQSSSHCFPHVIFPFRHLYFLSNTNICWLYPDTNPEGISEGQVHGAPFSIIYLVLVLQHFLNLWVDVFCHSWKILDHH